jgi:GNAT superfamily N-acetyltransferase
MTAVEVHDCTPDRWDDVVAVFEGPGDPGRCQWFYRGARIERPSADRNRDALRSQVADRVPGVLGYLDGAPSGWCAVAPRPTYTRLARSRVLAGVPTEEVADPAVWSVTCFVVRRPARRRGLSGALLAGAVDVARRGGATVVEGYPVDLDAPAPTAGLYPGPLPVFLRAGFTQARRTPQGRPVVRLTLQGTPVAAGAQVADGGGVDPFRGLGMPRIPGLSELLSILQTQTEALAQLPRTLSDLNGTVRELTEATTMARETIASAQRIAERLEDLVNELEEPVRALKPGIERVGKVLDDPAVDTVPDTLRKINEDLMPLIHGLRQAQSRVGSVAGLLRRRPRDGDWPEDDGY